MFANIFHISIFQWNDVLTTQNHMNSGVIVGKKMVLCAYLLQQMTDVSLFCFTVITSHSAACNTFRHLWESMAQMAWNEKSFPNIVSIFIELNLGAGNGTLCYMDSKQMSALTGSRMAVWTKGQSGSIVGGGKKRTRGAEILLISNVLYLYIHQNWDLQGWATAVIMIGLIRRNFNYLKEV